MTNDRSRGVRRRRARPTASTHVAAGDGKGHTTRAGTPSSSTCRGPTLATRASARSASCSVSTSSGETIASGLSRRTSVPGACRCARAWFTPAANPPLRPGSRYRPPASSVTSRISGIDELSTTVIGYLPASGASASRTIAGEP
ncbi:hypothetical protein BJF88_10405 [Cellulosimicrobium sp. CUA-896]|nr:hypothetical protein BJF88_10405 [Cellulosimicrobium sp. CUA-896]